MEARMLRRRRLDGVHDDAGADPIDGQKERDELEGKGFSAKEVVDPVQDLLRPVI